MLSPTATPKCPEKPPAASTFFPNSPIGTPASRPIPYWNRVGSSGFESGGGWVWPVAGVVPSKNAQQSSVVTRWRHLVRRDHPLTH